MNAKVIQCMFGKGKGGIEQVYVDHTRALAQSGFEVFNACNNQSPYIPQLRQITRRNPYTFTNTRGYNPFLYAKILKMVKQVDPDIIFMHGNRAISIFTNLMFRKFLPEKTKLSATTHNYRNKLFPRLDGCLAITEDLMKDLAARNILDDKIYYCPNSVPLQEKKSFSFHQPPVIGTLGRLHPVKGYDILLQACRILKEKNVAFKLVIGGDGEQLENLKILATELDIDGEVEFSGWVEDKKKFFDDIDIFCLPSRSEGLGISLLEAMSYSKPCVVTNCKGPREVLSHLDAGIVTENQNPEELANGLYKLISSYNLSKHYAVNGWKTIQKIYSDEKLNKRLENICKQILY